MRSNNANFNAKNQSLQKSPRFVIEIDFSTDGTDLNYFTSHNDIPTVTPVIHGVLKETSSISQKLVPERANSSIGSLSFKLVDVGSVVTNLFNTKRINRQVLFGKRVRLYLGYQGMAWADYRLEQTQFIDKKIKYKNAIYSMSCKDSQDRLNKQIFQPLETRLSASLIIADTTINVYNLTDWQLVERDADFLDAPSSTCTYLEISDGNNKEYCRVTAIGANFTVVRGVLGSTAQAWTIPVDSSDEKGPKVKELIFVQMKSLKLAYAVMTGVQIGQVGGFPPHWHLAMDTPLLNQTDFVNQDDFIAYSVGLTKTDGKKFIESEVMLPNSRYLRVNGSGALDVKRIFEINSEASPVLTLDESSIIKYSDLTFDSSATSNKFEIDWSYDPLPKKAEFRRKSTFIFADSVTDYGEQLKALKFRLINGVTATTSTLINIVNSFADRFAGEAARLNISTFSINNDLEVGDVVLVKHAGILDFNSGASINRSMQIINTKVDQAKGLVDLQLFGSTFTPAPLTDGTLRVMSDAFYIAAGQTIPNIVSGALTADTTLAGTSDHNANIFFFAADLTINAGVTLTISDNVQLRVMGHLTVLGTINAIGNGRATGSGYIGTSVGKKEGLPGDTQSPGDINQGLFEAFPTISLENPDGLSINGIPDDLRGTAGAQGADAVNTIANPDNISIGGTGNDSGSALVIICRGMSLSGAGAIDVSGIAGNAAVLSAGPPIEFALGGRGGHSTPGGFLVLLDGGTSSVPNLFGRITALSNDPNSNNGLDIKQSAARIQFIPQPRIPVADDVIIDSTVTIYDEFRFSKNLDPNTAPLIDLTSLDGRDWQDVPPASNGNGLWFIQAQRSPNLAWQAPIKIDGAGATHEVEYSIDGVSGFHSLFNAGDEFMRIRVIGAGAWDPAKRITDESANSGNLVYFNIAFQRSTSSPLLPLGDDPTGWSSILPILNGNEILWFTKARRTDSALLEDWALPVKISGEDGTDGDYVDFRFRRALTQPATPTLSDPAEWLDTPPAANGNPLWMVSANKNANDQLTSLWSDPVIFEGINGTDGIDGGDGIDGADGIDGGDGVNGNTVAQITIYRRSASAPSTPTGGSFNFTTNTISPPSGWSSTVPAGTNDVYSSTAIASIVGTSGTDTSIPWGSPNIFVQNGTVGDDGQSVYQVSVFRRAATAPATPAVNSGSYNFTTNALTPPAGWFVSPPSGTDPLYASQATFEITGVTGTDSTQTWTTPVITAQNGNDGQSTYLFNIYRRLASAPATPTGGSFNFGTNTPIAPANWSITVPAGTDPVYISQALASVSGDTGTDSSLTWSTPVILAQNGDDGLGADPILNSTTNPIAGLTHISVGNSIQITWSFSRSSLFNQAADPPSNPVTVQLRRGGVVIDTALAVPDIDPSFWSYIVNGPRTLIDTPGVGNATYTVVTNDGSTDNTNTNGSISTREEQ